MAQVVWMTVVRAAPSYRREGKLLSWLLRLARNTCINELRLHRERFEVSTEEIEEHSETSFISATFTADLDRQHTLAQLKDQIDALPKEQRAVMSMFINEELSYEQIASELQISESAVKSLLFRARKSLKAALEKTL